MKIKTQDLIGPALDWAVAKCEGRIFSSLPSSKHYFSPSSRWAQGGPIIERLFKVEQHGDYDLPDQWVAESLEDHSAYGPTPLIAAMRCYVASKMGDETEVPDDLA